MSTIDRIFAGLKSIVELRGDIERMATQLDRLSAMGLDHEKRLIRMATMVEMAQAGRRGLGTRGWDPERGVPSRDAERTSVDADHGIDTAFLQFQTNDPDPARRRALVLDAMRALAPSAHPFPIPSPPQGARVG